MKNQDIPLLCLHGALSHLSFAVKQTFEDIDVGVIIQWREGTYLKVIVETRGRHVQRIVDQLVAGIFYKEYDYRFHMVCRPTHYQPYDFIDVSAQVQLSGYPSEERKSTNWNKMKELA